jgi:hypothetical protein
MPAQGQARAVAARREAGADRYPSLHVGGSVTRFEEPMTVRPLHGFDPAQPPEFDRTLIQGELNVSYSPFAGSGVRTPRFIPVRPGEGNPKVVVAQCIPARTGARFSPSKLRVAVPGTSRAVPHPDATKPDAAR